MNLVKKEKLKDLTQEQVRELFDYDPETGIVTRTKEIRFSRKGTLGVGGIVGSLDRNTGYLTVRINRKLYLLHRIVWLWWYGYWPEHNLDHIDRCRTNNRINNLRETTQSCNSLNARVGKNNKSGITGVWFDTRANRWVAEIMLYRKKRYLGESQDIEEAVCLRLAAEQCLSIDNYNMSSAHKFIYSMMNRGN